MYSINGVTSKNEFSTYISSTFLLVILTCFQLGHLVEYFRVIKSSDFNEVSLKNLSFNDLIAVVLLSNFLIMLEFCSYTLFLDCNHYRSSLVIDRQMVLEKMYKVDNDLFRKVAKALNSWFFLHFFN
jgi:uncharacterized membrane protein YqhA